MPYVVPNSDAAAALAALDAALVGADTASITIGEGNAVTKNGGLRGQLIQAAARWNGEATLANQQDGELTNARAAYAANVSANAIAFANALTAADRDIRRVEERLVVHGVTTWGSPPTAFAPSSPSVTDPTAPAASLVTLTTRLGRASQAMVLADFQSGHWDRTDGLRFTLQPELDAAKLSLDPIRRAADRPPPAAPNLPPVTPPGDAALNTIIARVNEFVASLGWT
jgi:hypothetical protein